MSEQAKICIIATGGTIASIEDPASDSLRPSLKVEDLVKTLPKAMSNIDIIRKDLFLIDSANMQPHHWQEISESIQSVHEDHPELSGFVITHGTDTMVYSASAVSLMVQELGKPIAFTGSQIPSSVPWSDGPRNILDAIRVASFADLGETCIVFNGEIHRPTRTKKVRVNSYDAFDSMDPTPLGVLSREIVLFEDRKKRTTANPTFDRRLDPNVFLLKVFPGMKPNVVSGIVEMGYHGLVIEGFGSGNIPSEENSLVHGIQEAVDAGCAVVISSQCAFGQAYPSLYEVSRASAEVGAISVYDMTSEAAFVKLAWILGRTKKLDEIQEMMMKNYVGEISFRSDVGFTAT
ncbi:asparaginase [Candidatus Thorarchaeota archaeon]|nr:MAG: asparaginase [Candidatus Thorarchaeota archaeon]